MQKRTINLFLAFCLLLLSGCIQHGDRFPNYPCQPPKAKPIKNVRVALALGTGGFRSIAHLGVIEVLEKEKIPIDLIVGASAGSMIGAAYCDRPKTALIKDAILNIKRKDIIESGFGSSSGRTLENFVNKSLSAKCFEELKIPLVVVSTNLCNNTVEIFRSGPIAPAILASSADPMVFKPVRLYGHYLVDGGVLNPVPVEIAQQFNPKLIISVNVTPPPSTLPIKNKKGLFTRCIEICFYKYAKCEAEKADVMIQPCFEDFDVYNDQKNVEAYESGKQAAYAAICKIRKLMQEKGIDTN
jgi:NTE family protein